MVYITYATCEYLLLQMVKLFSFDINQVQITSYRCSTITDDITGQIKPKIMPATSTAYIAMIWKPLSHN